MKLIEEFRFNAGRLALDLAATLRKRPSEPVDVLSARGAPLRWLQEVNLLQQDMEITPAQEDELKKLRESIWEVSAAASQNERPPKHSVSLLNSWAKYPSAVPQLNAKAWTVDLLTDNPFRTALATIARDAIELVASPLRNKIKACEQPDCRMLFLDLSRSSRRRWCSMDRCGSRAKGETFRYRHSGG